MYFKLLTINIKKMEKTSNERLCSVLKTLNIDTNEAANRVGLSYTTMHRIVTNANNPNKSTLKSIANGLNLNYDWLLTGKGKMFNESKTNAGGAENPYKDALVAELKQANERLIEQNKWFQQLVNQLTGGLKPNFRKAAEKAIMLMSANNKQLIAKA